MKLKTTLAIAALAPVVATCLCAQKPAPASPVVHLPFTRDVDFKHLNSLHVNVTFNGGPTTGMEVDTGSTGVMIGADDIPGFDGKGEPGEITYSSSGVHLVGVWTTVDVGFPDAKMPDGSPVVAHMPVLAVTRRDCTGKGVNAAKCEPGPSHPHMFGVGFGRGRAAARYDAQMRNPFVMLNAMQEGKMHRSYVINSVGINLGVGRADLQDWKWSKLEPRFNGVTPADYKGPRDYITAPGTFEVDGKKAPDGTVLIDTGLTNMMLEAPGFPQDGDVESRKRVSIYLLGGQYKYNFFVGDQGDSVVPRRVSWRSSDKGTFVNTGLRALAIFDYCYDSDDGYLGLHKRN